ncbi:DUF2798 domain-containing protein [Paenibacillus sp. FSL R7-0345]|uniref:DUF2798 domain-containing protein n=1 Tax=Paenibacillus sp. FSL R7-0345 TaxID=2954535 RepID=UPI00315AD5B2
MGRNKKEALVFTSMTCFLMVVGMSFYNVIISIGATNEVFLQVAVGLLPALAVALVLDIFVVSKIAKGLAFKLLKPSDPVIKKVLTISSFMVCGMVLCMSLYGTLAHYGFGDNFFRHYLSILGLNFICALPLQLLVVGPLARFLFTKIYPAKAAVQSV